MKRFFALTATILLATLMLVGCASNSSTPNPGQSQSGNVFVTGEDAPLPSVVGLDITINSITLNGKNNSPQVISAPTTVDFARLLGLRSPLAFNSVPADTYSSATFVLANPVISWVDMSQNPPAVTPMPGTLPQSPYTDDGQLPHTNGCGKQWSRRPENGIRRPAIPGRQQRTNLRRRESGHLYKSHEGERS